MLKVCTKLWETADSLDTLKSNISAFIVQWIHGQKRQLAQAPARHEVEKEYQQSQHGWEQKAPGICFWAIGIRFWAPGIGFWAPGIGFWAPGIRFWAPGIGFWAPGIRPN